MKIQPGTLYVVATPIGNIDDLSPRAREVLAKVSLVAAEDTRHAGQLLTRLGISARLVSLHEHNEAQRSDELLALLKTGSSIALVSDAGTPLISDPGYRLLAAARAAELPVSPIPGCCALIAALSVAGLPTDRFLFEGFLPARRAARLARLRRAGRRRADAGVLRERTPAAGDPEGCDQRVRRVASGGGRARTDQAARNHLSRHAGGGAGCGAG